MNLLFLKNLKDLYIMRKIRRRFGYKVAALLSLLIIIIFLFFIAPKEMDRSEKILIMERSIRSPMNRGECHLPQLPMDDPEVMKYYHTVEKVQCGNILDDWVTCEKSICFVKPEISATHGEVLCTYTDIIRKSDYDSRYGKSTKTKEPYILRDSDFVKVVCHSATSGSSWYGMAYGIRDGVAVKPKIPPKVPIYAGFAAGESDVVDMVDEDNSSLLPKRYNVLMFGFDSLSRNAFQRKLPKTYSYLMQELKAIVLKGYNIVGDGTPQALVPLLTGYTELELPETRTRIPNARNVDVYPMIWKEYARQGYYTSFNEDMPNIGTFTYRMKGFHEQPVDHYLRTLYMEARNMWNCCEEHCIGHQADHIVMMEYTKNFMLKYKDSPRFVFSFHGGLSHDSINLVGAADEDLSSWLRILKETHVLDNTILIMMSDHGNRFAAVRATLQGKQEERLPFFSFTFPRSFQKQFPHYYAKFVGNAESLTTPFDVHATLQHLIELQNSIVDNEADNLNSYHLTQTMPTPYVKRAQNRAISLFDSIPKNRSCSDAYIEPHWCACLNWQRLSLNESESHMPTLRKAAESIVATINNLTDSYRALCAPLELERINWALRLHPHKELITYKQNSDKDGYVADMSDKMRIHEELYQLQIVVVPGQSLFEASVVYDLDTFEMHTKVAEISRVNKYGNQANCIYERNPELRKYCYCRA
ncbi:uncharacterized protein LOC101462680 isoform X2 [Ceratitis capitata]|uniref:uncharacterized protein LOC101462680 isoform X2 n=1 Tax=Ceratitis capitata TaxID=7213 RepID=UPI000A11E9F0|nr:uncharacterized protein LOC101462680 isoform X2 [Ceratitis capitata]